MTSEPEAPPPLTRLGPKSQAISYRALWGEGHTSSQSLGDHAHSLSPKASEGTHLSFFLLLIYSLVCSLSQLLADHLWFRTLSCSLSPWTQLCPLLSGSTAFSLQA